MPSKALTVPQQAIITNNVPAVRTGGVIESAIDAFVWERRARSVDSLTRLNVSEAACFNAMTQVVQAKHRLEESLLAHQELPERWGHELQVRRTLRANEYREAQHIGEIGELRRLKEITHADTEYTNAKAERVRAETVLTDAGQQLYAQRKHGALKYEITHAKGNLEKLQVELSQEEARNLMRHQLEDIERGDERIPDDEAMEIEDALYARRDQLNAAGLDTSRVEAVIKNRRKT